VEKSVKSGEKIRKWIEKLKIVDETFNQNLKKIFLGASSVPLGLISDAF
jgi:hypothetical protein